MPYSVSIVIIVLFCLIGYGIKKCFPKNPATDIAALMMSSGVGLIVSAFSGSKEVVLAIIASFANIKVSLETEPLAVVAGFLLIASGIIYKRTIKDRTYILNMYGMYSQLDVSDIQHVEELNLADFKVKENIIDFVDIF